ncbi:MAG: InlB B-repeat-containing protein [Clostridia bacterium]|nr:InlB B-repeat-containing protein [Clostridia bacterium]
MKKRLLSLLFAVITIFNMMPWGVMASETETETNDPVPLDVTELEMGKLYSATFDYEYDTFIPYKQSEEDPDLLEWKGFPDVLEDDAYVSKADFPQQLIVRRLYEDDEFVIYVTNEDWPEEYNEYRIIDIAEIIITGEYVAPNPPAEGEIVYGEVGLTVGGKTVENLAIAKGDKVYVSADLSDAITGTPTYVWQLLIDSANDRWAVIQDYAYPYAVVSEALIANAGIDGGNVTLRCVAEWNGASYVSSELGISVSESQPDEAPVSDFAASVEPVSYNSAESSGASQVALLSTRAVSEEPATVSLMSTRSVTEEYPKVAKLAARVVTEAFQIQIDYIFKHASSSNNGEKAAQAVTVTIPEGAEEYSGTIPSTPVVGYLPVVSAENTGYIKLPDGKELEDLKTTYNEEIYYIADTLELVDISGKTSITVYYIPQEVNFRVFIYEQQLYTDGYDLAGTVTKTGISDTAVGEGLSESRIGFTPLYYDPETVISGDGTTVVKLYYDRNYYLVKFDLNDTDKGTAYGATPFYVRYNTQVMLPTPTLPGYDFTGWELTSVYEGVKTNGSSETVPGARVNDSDILALYDQKDGGKLITVRHMVNYTANWKTATTTYTVIYWVENANNDDFSVAGYSEVTGATPGAEVDATDNIPTSILNSIGAEKTGLVYIESISDKDVTVKGDGTSSVNVYYKRKLSALYFYASAKCALELHTHNASCQATCTQEAHTHSIECGVASQTCGKEEHNHTGDCCSMTEHTHTSLCCSIPVHTQHNASCCTIAEHTQHNRDCCEKTEHTHEWYCNIIGCSQEEHTHGTNCFCSNTHTHGDGNCICDKTHDHTSGCSCSITAHIHNNGNCNNEKCGKDQHSHTVSCYTYNCGKTEHSHTGVCFRGCTQVEHKSHSSACDSTSSYSVVYAAMVKYGADTTSVWNNAPVYRWKLTQSSTRAYTTAPTMPDEDLSTYGESLSGASNKYTIHFYERGTTNKIREDTIYYRSGGSSLGDEDYIDVPGFTFYTGDSEATNREFVVQYTRNSYEITFNDGEREVYSKTLPFEADISNVVNEFTLQTPSSKETGSVKFVGWYTTPTCADGTEFDFAGQIMPINGVHLFAKWEDCSYTGKVYLDSSKTELLSEQTVLFGKGITVPDYTINGKYTSMYKEMIFSGWYYMDGSEEKRFDFNTMVIKQDLDIYAKWTSHVPVQYTVYYVLKDNNSVNIADPMEGECLAGESKTFAALMGTDLYEGYRVGYFPKSRSTSKVMSSTEVNEIIFEYYIPTHLEYTVEHEFVNDDFIDIIGVNTIKLSKTITIDGDSVKTQSANLTISFEYGITKDTIAEATGKSLDDTEKTNLYNIVTQMSPDYIQQDIILVPEDKNIIKFNWANRGSVSTYQVVYYSQTLDANGIQNGYKVDYTLTFVGDIAAAGAQPGDPGYVEAETPAKNGFIINGDKSITFGYIKKATIGDNTSGLILKIYYDREVYSYKVHHYKQGTTVSLGEYGSGTACFGAIIKISDVAKSIDGYNLSNGTDSVEIASDNQEIICYYIGQDVIYRYQVEGDTSGGTWDKYDAIAQTTIVGEAPESNTLKLFEGYYLNRWYYQIDDGAITDVPSGWLSADKMTLQPTAPTADMANKTVTVYAEVLPTILEISITEDVEKGVIFNITGANDFSMRVVVFGPNSPVSVYGLTNGAAYTVKMDPDWAWQYGVSPESYNNVTIYQQTTRAEFKLSPENNNIVTAGTRNNQ